MKNTAIVYYLSSHLKDIAERTQDQKLLEFFDLFNVFTSDSCIIDRTGTITIPFKVHSLYPIPEQKSDIKNFEELCFDRAREILSEGKLIYLLYSGGIDSTCVLLSFHNILKQKGDFSQIVIATTPEGQYENQAAWREIILPHYKLIHVCEMLTQIKLDSHRYVMGENGDQVFGNSQVFLDREREFLHLSYSKETLNKFLSSRVKKSSLDRLHNEFSELVNKCPLPIKWFRDFFWWINFTCDWQNVAIRTLCWTNIIENKVKVTQLKQFDTFFNTIPFQQLSMSGKVDRWGSDISPYSYKQTGREFILKYTNWSKYISEKMKVGSLWNAFRQVKCMTKAIGYKNGYLFATELPSLQGSQLISKTEELMPTIDSPSLSDIDPINIEVKNTKLIHRYIDLIHEAEIQPNLVYRSSTLSDTRVWANLFIRNKRKKAWILATNLITDPAACPIVTTWKGKIIQMESYRLQADGKTVTSGITIRIDRKRPRWFWTKMAKKLLESLDAVGVEEMSFTIRKENLEYMQFLKNTYGAVPISTDQNTKGILMSCNIKDALKMVPDWPERKSLPNWSFKQGSIEVREGREEDLPELKEIMEKQWGERVRKNLALKNVDEWWYLDRATLLLGYINGQLHVGCLMRHRNDNSCLKMSATPVDKTENLTLFQEVVWQWAKDAGYSFSSSFMEKSLYNRTKEKYFPQYRVTKELSRMSVPVLELTVDLKDRGIK